MRARSRVGDVTDRTFAHDWHLLLGPDGPHAVGYGAGRRNVHHRCWFGPDAHHAPGHDRRSPGDAPGPDARPGVRGQRPLRTRSSTMAVWRS